MSQSAKEIFTTVLPERLVAKASAIASIKGIFEFNVTGDGGGVWSIDFNQAGGKIAEGSLGKADCTLTIASADFSDLIGGKLNPQMAFMGGKLKVAGNIGLSLKLGAIL